MGLNFIHKFDNFLINLQESKIEFSNTINFDYTLPLRSTNPIITSFSIENDEKSGTVLFDTGALQSMFFDLSDLTNKYKSSKGWAFPSAFGNMLIDYYAEIPVYSENQNLGNYTFGYPTNLPQMPFKYVLGLNFMSEFIVNLNFKKNIIELKRNNIQNNEIFKLNQDTYSIGIQMACDNNEFFISNILSGFECDLFCKNDKITLLGEFNRNSFYNAISSTSASRAINMAIKGKDITLHTKPIFK